MSNEKDMISIDQLFADKLSEGSVDIDPNMAWEQMGANGSAASFWTMTKLISVIGGGVLLAASIFILRPGASPNNTSELAGNSEIIQSENVIQSNKSDLVDKDAVNGNIDVSSAIDHKNVELNKENAAVQNSALNPLNEKDKNDIVQNDSDYNNRNATSFQNQASSQSLATTTTTTTKDVFNQNEIGNSLSVSRENEKARSSSGMNTTASSTSSGSISNVFSTNSNEVENKFESGLVNTPSASLENQIRNSISFASLPMMEFLVERSEERVDINTFAKPTQRLKKWGRWNIDLGVSRGAEYELREDFSLNTIDNRLRVTYFSLGREHIAKERLSTRVHLSYHKIYGTAEFNGNRIVRTYADDNISAGYNASLKLFGPVHAELGAGLGVSFIDKTEYEQKPFWLGGVQVYEDYTETSFKMNPVMTYQGTARLLINLPYKIDLFGGATYRSQFADQLSSKETARENTLTKFADLQYVLGLRYNI